MQHVNTAIFKVNHVNLSRFPCRPDMANSFNLTKDHVKITGLSLWIDIINNIRLTIKHVELIGHIA